jgi:hypothetical protein
MIIETDPGKTVSTSNVQDAVAEQAEMIEAILATTVSRTYLSEKDVSELRKNSAERVWDRKRVLRSKRH